MNINGETERRMVGDQRNQAGGGNTFADTFFFFFLSIFFFFFKQKKDGNLLNQKQKASYDLLRLVIENLPGST